MDDSYFYHGTTTKHLKGILKTRIKPKSYWSILKIASMYAIDVAEDEQRLPVVIRIPESRFDESAIVPDMQSLEEPPTYTLGKSEYELRDNKIALTKEERQEVTDANVVWYRGTNGEETPVVWKSKDSKGKIVYVCNTHRAYNTAPTLKGVIGKFHRSIKVTA